MSLASITNFSTVEYLQKRINNIYISDILWMNVEYPEDFAMSATFASSFHEQKRKETNVLYVPKYNIS